jgi:hypothetical protein
MDFREDEALAMEQAPFLCFQTAIVGGFRPDVEGKARQADGERQYQGANQAAIVTLIGDGRAAPSPDTS